MSDYRFLGSGRQDDKWEPAGHRALGVMLDGMVPPKLVRELVVHSYQLMVDALPKKVREGLKG